MQPEPQARAAAETESLVNAYLDVMNRALTRHGDRFPLEQVPPQMEKMIDGKQRIGIAVLASDSSAPEHHFTAIVNPARRLEVIARGEHVPDVEWKLARPHMERVAADPERFIDDPSQLSWDWLSARFS